MYKEIKIKKGETIKRKHICSYCGKQITPNEVFLWGYIRTKDSIMVEECHRACDIMESEKKQKKSS